MLRDQLSHDTLSSISRMVLSNKYFSKSEHDKSIVKLNEMQGILDEWLLVNGVCNIGDWIPWLSFLDLQGCVKKMKALCKKLDRFHNYVIDDHIATKAAEKDFIPKDFVDVLLQLAEDPNFEVKLTRDNIKGLLQGGWAQLNPLPLSHELKIIAQIMAKEELDRVIGRNRWVEENDFSQLPYMDAIIMESLRLHPLATLLVPHYAIEDCNIAGYDISEGTTVLINTWSIVRDTNT
ncbi:hypothetical protein Pfo_020960 [Paulownia fortunei]|nr:hypothetical protein Pfo_020960 [Paulownia fortunei]